MLASALEADRLFAIASRIEDSSDEVYSVGGLGIVRACVANSDGTSNLILQGLVRVKFLSWSTHDGYPYAEISVLHPDGLDAPQNPALQKEILGVLSRQGDNVPDHLLTMLAESPNSSVFADLAAAAVVADFPVRQRLLEEVNATRRLEILASYLSSSAAFAG